MRNARLLAIFGFVVCFTIAAYLDPWFNKFKSARETNILTLLIGDSRRLFANHIYAKADAYFHSGYYPSIFDRATPGGDHMREGVSEGIADHGGHDDHAEKEEGQEEDHLGKPRDWIDAFGRNFYPSRHTHMEKETDEKEILPWLKFSAELDPHKVDAYVIASFTLRKKLGKGKEAEQFLRQGLRDNPDSYEILLELGRVREEEYHDARTARNLWELGIEKWQKQSAAGKKPDELTYAQLLGFLADLEEHEGNLQAAIDHFEQLKAISPNKKFIDERISSLRQQQGNKASQPQ